MAGAEEAGRRGAVTRAPDRALVDRLRAAGCVWAEEEARLLTAAAASPDHLAGLVARRVTGEPLEHVVGAVELGGIRVAVEPGVFVPRRRTELLVREAAARLSPGAVVVDLCCGSGAVGAALLAAGDGVELHAADVDPAAVHCARRNLEPAGGLVHRGDLYSALPPTLRGRVDVLVANAPYVPTAEVSVLPAEARDHEPRVALDGGADGLAVLRRVVEEAPGWLASGGHLLVETSRRQSRRLRDAMARHGLAARVVPDDELEATVVVATGAGGTRWGRPDPPSTGAP